jgi:hypothetical protein
MIDSGNKLVRVVAPHFVAGIVFDRLDHRAVDAAPILLWAIDKHEDVLRAYFRRKGWKATIVEDYAP